MKTAIIGCGGIAQVHAKSLENLENVDLVAAVDSIFCLAEQMVKQYGGTPYDSIEKMLQKEKPDVIHICTPHVYHTPMAIQALQKGIHVFMEKPPVISREQLRDLQVVVEKSNDQVQLGICFQNRYNESVKYVKKILTEENCGKIIGARGIVTWLRDGAYYQESSWRGKKGEAGGGALMNQAIHTLDLLQYFIEEEPLQVEAMADQLHMRGQIEVEDTMSLSVRYQNAIANLYVTTGYVANPAPILDLVCENATIRIEGDEVRIFYKDGLVNEQKLKERELLGKSYWGASHEKCIKDFYNCVQDNKCFPINLSSVRNTIEIMLSAYERCK